MHNSVNDLVCVIDLKICAARHVPEKSACMQYIQVQVFQMLRDCINSKGRISYSLKAVVEVTSW